MSLRGGRPPGSERWFRLLDRMLPEEERTHVRVELERLYEARVARYGAPAARRWLRRQVLAFAPAVLRRALGGAGHTLLATVADIRRAARLLRRAPTTSTVVVITLGLGIAAGALVFTIVDGVLLRPLPFEDPGSLVQVWDGMTRGELQEIRRRAHTLTDARGYFDGGAGVNLELKGSAYRVATTFVEPGLFDLLGAHPLLGRLFAREESEAGRTHVALLSEGLWRSMFAADPGVVGRSVTLDGQPYEVVGVMPAAWTFPDPSDRLWLPLDWDPTQAGPFWGSGGVEVVGRLAPGATATGAQAELRRLAPGIARANPVWTPEPGYRAQAEVQSLREALVRGVRTTLWVLLAAVATVLLVVCANVSSILVARAVEQRPTVAVRTALGASRGRVVREALAESGLLGLVGSTLGVIAARGGLTLLRPLLAGRLPRAEELAVNGVVLAASIGVGVTVGLAAGVLPALRAARSEPGRTLNTGARGGGPGIPRRRLSAFLVGSQVSATVVLVTAAVLLVRSLQAMGSVDPGFQVDHLVTADVTFPSTYDEGSTNAGYDALLQGMRAIPGVEGAALAGTVPFGARREAYATFIEGVTTDPNDLPSIDVDRVTPSYFDVMGIPVMEGRAFTDSDRPGTRLVAVVDELMAKTFWPGRSAVGRRIRYPWAGAPWIEVVGVVGSVSDDDVTAARRPRWYIPLEQRPAPDVTAVIASDLSPSTVGADVRRAVAAVSARLPVSHIAAYAELLGASSTRTRLTTWVLLAFALAALLLGCLGVYGMAAHTVRERRREIGVRMALGAGAGRIGASVMLEALKVAGAGAVVGLLGAAAATRVLSGLLYGVRPLDPVTFAVVPLVIFVAALMAVWAPVRRAAALDPVRSLREG